MATESELIARAATALRDAYDDWTEGEALAYAEEVYSRMHIERYLAQMYAERSPGINVAGLSQPDYSAPTYE